MVCEGFEQRRGVVRRDRGKDRSLDRLGELSAERAERGDRCIWASLARAIVTCAVVMVPSRGWARVCVRACDNRDAAMLEGRHEPGRGERSYAEQQREQRGQSQARDQGC